ncbi:MAG: response regulator [Acidimicrobiales bacterium]
MGDERAPADPVLNRIEVDMSESAETPSMPACRVVLVDARENRREVMRHVVEGDDAKAILVGVADSRATALEVVDQQRPDAVILDVQMPVPEGLATIAALRERHEHLGIVVCSFDLDEATVEAVLAHGADRSLAKPVSRADIQNALSSLPHRDRPAEASGGAGTAVRATADTG